MLPLIIEGSTHKLHGKDGIIPLHVKQYENCFISRWELLPSELEMLNAGGCIELWVMDIQPPVAIVVTPKMEELK